MSDYDETFEEETPDTSDASSRSGDGARSGGNALVRDAAVAAPVPVAAAADGGAVAEAAAERQDSVASLPSGGVPAAGPSQAIPVPVPVPVPVPIAAAVPGAGSDEEGAATGAWGPRTDSGSGRPRDSNTATDETSWDRPVQFLGAPDSRAAQEGTAARPSTESGDDRGAVDGGVFGRIGASSLASGSVSVLTGAEAERRRVAREAVAQPEFQTLSRFVAFGQPEAAASDARGSEGNASTSHTATGERAPARAEDDRAQESSQASPKPSELPSAGAAPATPKPAEGVAAAAAATTAAVTAAVPQTPGTEGRGTEKTDSTPDEPSSVFSTLSQHLKTEPSAAAAAPPQFAARDSPSSPSATPASGAAVKSTAAAPAQAGSTVGARPSAPHSPFVPGGSGGVAAPPANASSAMPEVRIALPSLPVPAFAAALSSAEQAARLAGDGRADPAGATAPVPPPLPPADRSAPFPAAAPALAAQLDPKVAELRETSEAVERLVRAFALLRGHGADGGTAKKRSPPEATSRESLHSTTMHKVGADATVREVADEKLSLFKQRQQRLFARTPQSPLPLSAEEKTAVLANEQRVEEVLLSCVVEMLQTDLGRAQRSQRIVERVKHQPPVMTVTAEQFLANGAPAHRPGPDLHTAGARQLGQRPSYTVFDGELRAFDATGAEGSDAAEALFQSIQSNLQKYVLSHVVDPTKPQLAAPAPSPSGGAGPTPITPHFAWVLLTDLLTLCMDVLERGFTASASDGPSSTPPFPVIVKYEGDRHSELLARNAIHCLPFEVIESTVAPGTEEASRAEAAGLARPPAARARRPLFRMDFWVTRASMFTIVEAVAATLRAHVRHISATSPYAIFATDINPFVSAHLMVPSAVPMFRLVNTRLQGGQGATAGALGEVQAGGARPRRELPHTKQSLTDGASDDSDSSFFGLPPDAVRSVAYTVSTIATSLLEKTQSSATASAPLDERKRQPSSLSPSLASYGDLTTAVTTTLRELLDDQGVRAAVERRSLECFSAMQRAKKEYPTKTRLEKERVMIEKAEKDAEELVKKITQEMLVRQAGV